MCCRHAIGACCRLFFTGCRLFAEVAEVNLQCRCSCLFCRGACLLEKESAGWGPLSTADVLAGISCHHQCGACHSSTATPTPVLSTTILIILPLMNEIQIFNGWVDGCTEAQQNKHAAVRANREQATQEPVTCKKKTDSSYSSFVQPDNYKPASPISQLLSAFRSTWGFHSQPPGCAVPLHWLTCMVTPADDPVVPAPLNLIQPVIWWTFLS